MNYYLTINDDYMELLMIDELLMIIDDYQEILMLITKNY